MRTQILIALSILLFPLVPAIADPTYCPQHAGYIDVGMSEDEVINACGQPLSKERSKHTATQKVPVQQLLYNSINPGSVYPGLNAAFYTQWSLASASPSAGVSLEVDVVNNKVKAFQVNGSSTNSITVCQGSSIQMGDNVSNVYNSCGTPTTINSTYINEAIPGDPKTEIWIYQNAQYQPPMSLTFVNGTLQSIQ
ncbi:MAG: DUF2845 domain-containing protein [Legionellales bacterium]|nr:DUF2845 domain-containing protein [Legionellales bacterium]